MLEKSKSKKRKGCSCEQPFRRYRETLICFLLVVDRVHVLDEFQHLVGVTNLIVVPGNDLHEGVGQSDAGGGVEDGGAGVARKSEETTASSV